MSQEREAIIIELQSRLAAVEGNLAANRNPDSPPDVLSMPVINFFELVDKVINTSSRGGYPIYTRVLLVTMEPFIKASERGAESKELFIFNNKLKVKLYEKVGNTAPNSLSGLCLFQEVDYSRVLRPGSGENVAGIGITIAITYIEDTSKNI